VEYQVQRCKVLRTVTDLPRAQNIAGQKIEHPPEQTEIFRSIAVRVNWSAVDSRWNSLSEVISVLIFVTTGKIKYHL
jgi:hypothetical protein